MNIKQILEWGTKECALVAVNAALEARILLCYVLGVSKEKLLLLYNDVIDEVLSAKYQKLIARRKNYEPIAYIIGNKEFYGLEFIVNRNVLIPRSETELIIDIIIKNAPQQECSILDLGTGSGAIAVTLAKYFPNAKITAVDISREALKVAQINAQNHLILNNIDFILSNWYESLPEQEFDYIVSNPPYINMDADENLMALETKNFEPSLALYAKEKGLEAYKNIILKASQYLKPKGRVILEIGYNQAIAVMDLLKIAGFDNVESFQDLSLHDRVIIASRNW